jgi:hypothetical protein
MKGRGEGGRGGHEGDGNGFRQLVDGHERKVR